MLKTLRRNMTLLCTGITGVILITMSVISLIVSQTQLQQREQAMFESIVNGIAFRLTTESILDWNWLAQTEYDNRILLYVEDNGIPILFQGSWSPATRRDTLVHSALDMAERAYGVNVDQRPRSALSSPQALFFISGENGEQYRAAVIVIRTDKGRLSLTALKDTSDENQSLQVQRTLFLVVGGSALLLLLLFSWWFSGKAIRPVEKSQQQQAEFIAAASHELRTPLAVIQTSSAAIEYEPETQNARFVGAIERECARTSKLVDDLLLLANADAKGWHAELGPVELEPLLVDCIASFQALTVPKEQTLSFHKTGSLPVIAGDEHRLIQLFSILLDNAHFYTPQGGKILLSAEKYGRFVRLAVADNGPGVPAKERNRLFERFYRADTSRSKKEHYGLGLSIAWEIVRLHRGKISLLETDGGGLTVTIDLPLHIR